MLELDNLNMEVEGFRKRTEEADENMVKSLEILFIVL